MILDFKARLFSESVNIPRREIDASDPLWRDRIDSHLDGRFGLPTCGDPGEYAAAFEAVFPAESDRRSYIEEAVRRGSPSFGHRVLAALIATRQVPCLFTTNFDPLIERATVVADELQPPEEQAHLVVAALDSVDRAERCLRESAWPLLVKLHGDYQSVDLKNTAAELQAQDAQLRQVLIGACNRFGLIVIGYSGRDVSVMSALSSAAGGDSPFPAGVRWVSRSSDPPSRVVVEFMELAARRGVDAQWVQAETFDELAADIDTQASLPMTLAKHVTAYRPHLRVQPVSIAADEGGRFPALRLSALPLLELPTRARRLRLVSPLTTPDARSMLKAAGARGVVAARGDFVLAFAADADLLRAFGPSGAELDGEEVLTPDSDSLHLGLVYDALVRALTRRLPLRPILKGRGHSIVVAATRSHQKSASVDHDQASLVELKKAYGSDLFGTVPGTELPFAEGLRLYVENHDGRWWCVFDPYTWVDLPRAPQQDDPHGSEQTPHRLRRAPGPEADWRRERWATRRNKWWSGVLDGWTSLLVDRGDEQKSAFWFPDEPGINATFKISGVTAWSRPARTTGPRSDGFE
jgi:hypothetical protein